MCLILPARLLLIDGDEAVVELHGGMQARASLVLQPEASAGQYALVDRGLVLELIDEAEARAIVAMYDEIGNLLADAESAEALLGGEGR
ncbi:MAG: HypC/HybG/HupF family hydrogenase formation chaperone [Chloroflexi bacterium]|nr:HypC/HybG/HupF family hydrogenase formation chaperone [Chloroflexota bacterium]